MQSPRPSLLDLHPVEALLALLLISVAALHRLVIDPPRPMRRPVLRPGLRPGIGMRPGLRPVLRPVLRPGIGMRPAQPWPTPPAPPARGYGGNVKPVRSPTRAAAPAAVLLEPTTNNQLSTMTDQFQSFRGGVLVPTQILQPAPRTGPMGWVLDRLIGARLPVLVPNPHPNAGKIVTTNDDGTVRIIDPADHCEIPLCSHAMIDTQGRTYLIPIPPTAPPST